MSSGSSRPGGRRKGPTGQAPDREATYRCRVIRTGLLLITDTTVLGCVPERVVVSSLIVILL